MLNFQALNKPKMSTSLCDVTMKLQRQEKIGNIFFLKQDTFSTIKYMFDTFTPKFPREYKAAYTSCSLFSYAFLCILSRLAISLMRKKELAAVLKLCLCSRALRAVRSLLHDA